MPNINNTISVLINQSNKNQCRVYSHINKMFTFTLLVTVVTLLYVVYRLFTSNLDYWKKRKVPYEKPWPILGNYADLLLFKKFSGQVTQELCKKFENEPYFGTFYGSKPALVVHDPELIKVVLVKDFYYFNGREVTDYTDRELTSKNIFFSGGERWKVVRQNLTPLFSSAKMRNMFHLIENCSHEFETMLSEDFKASNEMDARLLMAKFTMGCIGSCAFGVNTHTMDRSSEENVFRTMGTLIFSSSTSKALKVYGRAIWPEIFYGLGFKAFPVELNHFFQNLLVDIFKSRGYKPSPRNDFIDLVLGLKTNNYITGDSLSNMKDGGSKKIKLDVDDELLVSQCVSFFAAGFETSSATSSFALFELAKNQEAQKRAQEEVDAYMKRHNNKLSYDCVNEFPFLEACLDETLRLYPVLANVTREVMEDYTMPSGLKLEKGLRVHIPVYALHHNPKYFPDPEKFIPERFLGENKKKHTPYVYQPFGEGPRICMGMRFAKMQLIAGLITFLKKFHLELADNMQTDIVLDPKGVVTQPEIGGGIGGIYLKWRLRDGWEERNFVRE